MDKQCPKCKLYNFISAQVCDCGYIFDQDPSAEIMEISRRNQRNSGSSSVKNEFPNAAESNSINNTGKGLFITCFTALLIYGLYGILTRPEYEEKRPIFFILCGIAGILVFSVWVLESAKKNPNTRLFLQGGKLFAIAGIGIWFFLWMIDALSTAPSWALALTIIYLWTKK